MRRETLEEIKKFTPPPKHPSPFASPFVAIMVAAIVSGSAAYANYARGNLFDELNKNYRVNEFEQVINNSTLKDSFTEEEWEYTIVAPSDQAFDKAQWKEQHGIAGRSRKKAAGNIAATGTTYNSISAYDYVTPTPIYPEDIKFGEHVRISSLSGNDIIFSRIQNGVEGLRINGQQVNSVHYADNGVIYVIDDIIVFPELQQQFSWAR